MTVIVLATNKYKSFAKVYDILNYDMPYNLWLDIIKYYSKDASSVLDIGVGTGYILRNLSIDKKFGIDNSEEMIDLAKSHHTDAELYVQDMIDFELDERFDLIIATADVLNYSPSKEDFLKVLNQAYKHLNENGIFIFDVHTEEKFKTDFNYELYSDSNEDVFYTWQTIPGEKDLSVWHELTFFIKESDGRYSKYEETHYQETYKHSDILQMAISSDFTIHHTFSDFDIDNPITDLAERNFYILKK